MKIKTGLKEKNQILNYLFRVLIILIALVVSFVIIKKIKYSGFMTTLNQNNEPDEPDIPDATKQPSDNYSASLDSFIFAQDVTGTKQIGQIQTVTEDTPNFYCIVNYPVIGQLSIDNALKEETDAIVNRFISDNNEYIAASPESRAYLSVDYQSYVIGDSIASFIFDIQYTSKGSNIQEVRTHNFFLAQGKEIAQELLFIGDYFDLFLYKAINYVNANPEFYGSDSSIRDKYIKKLSAHKDSFNNFSVNKDGLSIYFNPGEIAPEKFGCISFTITKNDILPFMIYDPFKEVTLPPAGIPSPETPAQPDVPAIDPSKPMVAFTFDDGPNKGSTERILDALEKNGVHATFFLVGNRISYNKDIVKRAYEMGCDIGSHSFDHARLDDMKKNKIKKEFSKTNDILNALIGDKAHFVRTPYGAHSERVLKAVNYPVILWNVDTEDWKSRNKKKILKRVIGKVNDGDIILMHDIYDTTADAVEKMIPKLISQGYQIVSISELFKAKGIEPQKGTAYFNIQ